MVHPAALERRVLVWQVAPTRRMSALVCPATTAIWCSWIIARWRCFNCIFILDLRPGFTGLCRNICRMRRDVFQFYDLVRLIYVFGGRYYNYQFSQSSKYIHASGYSSWQTKIAGSDTKKKHNCKWLMWWMHINDSVLYIYDRELQGWCMENRIKIHWYMVMWLMNNKCTNECHVP